MPAPFFIIGASRSGTTMLRLMLNAHSQVVVPPEMNYFHFLDLWTNLASWDRELELEEYTRFACAFLDRRDHLFPSERQALERWIHANEDRTFRGLFRVLMGYWTDVSQKKRWGEKTPRNIFYVDVISEMFPSSRFIHVVRDPRAVVLSMNKSPYYSEETVFNALNWRRSIREGDRLLGSFVPEHRQMTVRYEDLVRSPQAIAESICNFVALPFESAMLQFYETSDRHIHQPIQTPSIQQPINQKSLTKWEEELTLSDVTLVEAICASEMKRLGYDRRHSSAGLVALKVLHKTLYWRWKTWCHRHQRGYEVGYPPFARLQSLIHRYARALSGSFPTDASTTNSSE